MKVFHSPHPQEFQQLHMAESLLASCMHSAQRQGGISDSLQVPTDEAVRLGNSISQVLASK